MNNYPKLDLPLKVRRIIVILFLTSLIAIISSSLLGFGNGRIQIDKIIHFSAYTGLATLLMVGFPFRLALIGLTILAMISYGVEFLQPLNGRSGDLYDGLANTLGVSLGAGIGLFTRWLFSYLWTEFQTIRMKRNLRKWNSGQQIFNSGQELKKFWVIKSGEVELFNGENRNVVRSGEIIGLHSELFNVPSIETAVALTTVEAWELNIETIIEESGGPDQPISVLLKSLVKQHESLN
jgi:hypothetical protein